MKSNTIENSYGGVKVMDNISLSLPKRNSFFDHIPLILIAFCGCFGTVNSFMTMFGIDMSAASVNFYTIFFFLVFSLIFMNQKSVAGPLIPILLVYEFLLYQKWDSYLNGLMLVCNQVYQVLYPQRGEYFRLDLAEVNPDSDIKIFIAFTIFLLTMIICCVTIMWPDFFFGFLFTFPIVEIGLYQGKTPELLPAFILIVYWAALLAVHHSGYYRSGKRNKTGFIRKGNKFVSKPSIKFHSAGQAGMIMLAVSAVIISASVIMVGISGYSRSEKIDTMRSNVKTAVSEFTFDDIAGSLERISASFGLGTIKTYDHRLGNMDSISYSGSTDLNVNVPISAKPNDNIYLKGYVGSVYDGKSWGLLDDGIYQKNSAMFESFRQSGVYPQDMLYEKCGKTNTFYSNTPFKLEIKPSILNQKYTYTPYNSYNAMFRNGNEGVEYKDDTLIDIKEKKEYAFWVSPYQLFSGLINRYENMDNFPYSEYHDFVYENYLDVPNNADTEKLYQNFIEDNNSEDKFEQLKYIKNLLAENAEYTLQPGKTPSGRDFVSYFLLENHKGYCVHFATAGIILARMSGIPARYAEGYVVTLDDFCEENIKNNQYEIAIKDERAHAWAEIYIDGYGWVPYEFTPAAAVALSGSSQRSNNNINMPKITFAPPSLDLSLKSSLPQTSSKPSSTSIKPHTSVKSDGGSAGGKSIGMILSELSPEIKLTIVGISVLILMLGIVAAVHVLASKKREKSFDTGNNSKNAINAYNYIMKLLNFCEINNENMQYLEFADFAEHHKKRIFKTGELKEITDIALEAGLSGREISDEKSKKAVIFSYKVALNIFSKQTVFGKLYMKFIRNLC